MPNIGCLIEGCTRKFHARGWCNSHYERWTKYGDPEATPLQTQKGVPLEYFNETVRNYDGDECLFWPYCRTGVGYPKIKNQYVHRMACEDANGPPPTPEHEAAHSCGNGHLGCVTKRHLSWKTRIENRADMIGHGTAIRGEKGGHAKLTSEDVFKILEMEGTASCYKIAKQFGVHTASVAAIMRGDNWGWLTGRKRGDRPNA